MLKLKQNCIRKQLENNSGLQKCRLGLFAPCVPLCHMALSHDSTAKMKTFEHEKQQKRNSVFFAPNHAYQMLII